MDKVELRILVVDDHEVVRKGLCSLVGDTANMKVVGEAAGVEEALRLAGVYPADLALVDLRLPDGDGLALARRLKTMIPGIRIIILTAYPGPYLAESAFREGADGVLLKTINGEGILSAIASVSAGRTFLDPALIQSVAEGLRRSTEQSVMKEAADARLLSLLARGFTNKEIGAELGLSEKTIRNRLSFLYRRLGVGNRTEAALLESGTFVPGPRDEEHTSDIDKFK